MMNQYKYSPTQNLRYLNSLLPSYTDQGALPDDMIDISDDIAAEFFDFPAPEGKVRAAGSDGLPCWVDVPETTHESLVAQAEYQRSVLRASAESEISWRQDAVDAEIATDEETAKLAAWKKYRVLLMRVDTSTAPAIKWPPLPIA